MPSDVKEELLQVKVLLSIDPDKIAKPLKGKLQGKYRVYLGRKRYRLVCTIEVNTRKIFLYYVRPRTHAYS